MAKDAVGVPASMAVEEAADIVARDRLDAVVVMEGPHIAGVLTREDLLDAAINALEASGPARLSRILACPGDEEGARVVAVACALARRNGAVLTAVSVLPPSRHGFQQALESAVVEHVARVERETVRARLLALLGGEPALTEVLTGDLGEQVVRAARRLGADLVVMDARDASRVIGGAPCPVLAVPGA
jgi:nucleotide-binding universal stress UspA family protein